jgi:hypothetical protein
MTSSISNISNTEPISNVGSLCDVAYANNVLKYAGKSVELSSDKLLELVTILETYRDELIARIQKSDYLIDRANLMQVYYRLLSHIRSINSFLYKIDDSVIRDKTSARLVNDANLSYSKVAISNMVKEE